jgi:RNA-directed DNA polymerase
MIVNALYAWLVQHKEGLIAALLDGSYQPQAVRGVEIPKVGGSGKRQLGIPTVVDRLVQQAIAPSAGRDTGADLFGVELRLPARTQRPSGGAEGSGIRGGRASDRGGHRPGEVLRPGQPRRSDEPSSSAVSATNACCGSSGASLEAGMMQNGVCIERHEGTPQGATAHLFLSERTGTDFRFAYLVKLMQSL